MNTNDFIQKAKQIHGDKYDYSKTIYNGLYEKVIIICPKHGKFEQVAKNHLRGYGCSKCAREITGNKNRNSKESWIEKATIKFGSKYDYSKVDYFDSTTKVCIVCPKHGEFSQTPIAHLNSQGCPKCSQENRIEEHRGSIKDFVEKVKERHKSGYDYSVTNYVNSRTLIKVKCEKHGIFETMPNTMLYGVGCPNCYKEFIEKSKNDKNLLKEQIKEEKLKIKEIQKQIKKENFIKKSTEIHNAFYDYSNVKYNNLKTPVEILCPKHGIFSQSPNNHLKGCGCPKCAREKASLSNKFTKDEFINKAKEIHGDKYDYSNVEYVNNHTKVLIKCPKHGEFWQMPSMHINEHQGCPLCGTLSSFAENEIFTYIKEILPNEEIIQRDKTVLKTKEIDIYIPSLKIGIEYNGLRWHSELFNCDKNKHLFKMEECNKKGIKLIQIFEDEWIYKRDIVKEKLKHILKVKGNKEHIFARKCNIREINTIEAKEFLNTFHIQGFRRSSIYFGAFYNDKLIAVMTFLKYSDEWELNRFASDFSYICCGVGGKIFKYFIKKYNPKKVKSFADRRWTLDENNNLYTQIGFILDTILSPDYMYVTDKNSFKKRYHKFNFRKRILHKKYGLPLTMSESEMTKELGYYKIYDCGLIKYIWKNEI